MTNPNRWVTNRKMGHCWWCGDQIVQEGYLIPEPSWPNWCGKCNAAPELPWNPYPEAPLVSPIHRRTCVLGLPMGLPIGALTGNIFGLLIRNKK